MLLLECGEWVWIVLKSKDHHMYYEHYIYLYILVPFLKRGLYCVNVQGYQNKRAALHLWEWVQPLSPFFHPLNWRFLIMPATGLCCGWKWFLVEKFSTQSLMTIHFLDRDMSNTSQFWVDSGYFKYIQIHNPAFDLSIHILGSQISCGLFCQNPIFHVFFHHFFFNKFSQKKTAITCSLIRKMQKK